ncbi:MAG: GIY-YIG nuclease family protein [Pseudomonadota bacterium]
MAKGYVYMLSSRKNGTLYVGVTKDLSRRLYEHKKKLVRGFTSKYDVTRLVWFEVHDMVNAAIQREKSLKKYRRQWKINLIEESNPDWEDISHFLHQL